jgi:hypothetical protein
MIIVVSPCSVRAQIPTIEREALIALYNSTDGPNWGTNTNWLQPVGTECSWYAVTCSAGHVESLGLFDNELRGVIPPELAHLSYLQILDLETNHRSGTIPQALGNLSNLTMLILQYNELSGGIPPELGGLPNLVVLALGTNQLSGGIPPQLEDLSSLRFLSLDRNQLSGRVPSWLGNLPNLQGLSLSDNRFNGSIPPQLGNLSNLQDLFMSDNQLSGGIPPELGSLTNLQVLSLGGNQLSGSIPPQLGNLESLVRLYINSNQLSGSVPPDLMDLGSLQDGAGVDLRWNSLHSDSPALIAFLDGKQLLGDWRSTQTVAPENLSVEWVGDHTISLTWSAVSYSDPGGYVVYAAPSAGAAWTRLGWTSGKNELEFPATALDAGVSYELVATSYTLPHLHNQNVNESDFGDPEMATTADLGCVQPVIDVTWGEPTILTVSGSFDSYVWNTGETSPSINVDPSVTRFYWVTATSPGSCRESATVLVDQQPLFADGFESGNISAWHVFRSPNPHPTKFEVFPPHRASR